MIQRNLKTPSEEYLEPASNLGEATLHITVTTNGKHFIAEVYDEVVTTTYQRNEDGSFVREEGKLKEITLKECRPPRSMEAQNFIHNRFKHGCRSITRKGIFHPIFEIPITDYSVALIQKTWTGKKIISEAAKPFFNKIFLREFRAEQNARRTAEYKCNSIVPTSQWFDEHDAKLLENGITLNPYQKTASFNACMSNSYGFFCDPGTGKTAMMIRKLDYIVDHAQRETMTLIVCPKSVRLNWINEIKKFSTNNHRLFITTLSGNSGVDRAVNIINALSSDEAQNKHIVIISNYESFVQTPKLHNLEFDLLLADESHNFANPSTKRTKTFLEVRNKFHNVIIATGTPFRNSPFDGFPQLELLGEGYSGFDSFNAFKQFYGLYSAPQHYNGMQRLEGFQNIPLLQEKLAKHAFIIRKEEALPHLPKKTFNILQCNLTKEQMEVYLQLCNQLAAEIESYGPEPDSITVNNILTQMLRLAQITSGFAVTDQGTISRFDPNPKLELLIQSLLGTSNSEEDEPGCIEDKNNKAIVWCAFKENLKMIHGRLALEGIKAVTFHGSTEDKDDVVQQFNCDPETRVFVGIAASGGVGLNLVGFDPYNPTAYTTNTTNIFHYSKNWSAVNYTQSNDRAHRHNTRVPVQITNMLVPNSIDVEIHDRVTDKVQMGMTLQNIKKILTAMVPSYNGA